MKLIIAEKPSAAHRNSEGSDYILAELKKYSSMLNAFQVAHGKKQ